jgi:hypothetical protein
MRWEDETRLVQTQSGDHVDLEKCNLEALMTAGCGDLSLHAHTNRPTCHSNSLVPLSIISITLHVIVANMCYSNNTYNSVP